MLFNLIRDPWIPVLRTGGDPATIAPYQLTDVHGGTPETLAAPRADFNGALIQFLIGLVQTAFPPEDEDHWAELLETPPAPEELQEAFNKVAHAFNLDGDGPRFMQDYHDLDTRSTKAISNLLLDTPTGKTLTDNSDHFIKSREEVRYSPESTAMALLSMQLNAPSGGRGHRTSLRGGGPVTTVILGPTLWKTVWLNVLVPETIEHLYDGALPSEETDIFPWLAPTRTSEKKGGVSTLPGQVHPLQMYWSMSRRIRLEPAESNSFTCDLSGLPSEDVYSAFKTVAYGINYEGPWKHPLTPYRINTDIPSPVKGQFGGFLYRNWLGFVFADEDSGIEPALVVRTFVERANDFPNLDPVLDQRARLWVFGFDTDNMKVRSWHESIMPMVTLPDTLRFKVEGFARRLVRAAEHVAYQLSDALKKAIYGDPTVSQGKGGRRKVSWEVRDGVSRDQTLFANAEHQFWQDTENAFYNLVRHAVETVENEQDVAVLRSEWQQYLSEFAVDLYDELTQYNTFHTADPRAVVLARQKLAWNTSRRNKKMIDILNLPTKSNA